MIEPKIGEQLTGTVKWFDGRKGYGFVVVDGQDFFAHFRAIEGHQTFKELVEGQTVDFVVGKKQKGYSAENIRVVEPNGNIL